MKRILILGAGLSSSSLIKYLLEHSQQYDWKVVIGDLSVDIARKKAANHPNGEGISFDVFNDNQRELEIQKSDIVISMLPARFHHLVANDCVRLGKDMVTASYVSPEIKAMDEKAKAKDIIMLNEIGVDPGIDHMSAMQIIDKIRSKGGNLLAFKSSTGGLVAPESDTNPWNYKFTWNPRNVVLAGQGTAMFIRNGRYKYIPYNKLFSRLESVEIPEYGVFEIYPNRDSLKYRSIYGLEDIPTMFRGTMRRPGFSEAWNVFVQIGITDDTYQMENVEDMTYRIFINSFLPYQKTLSVETKFCNFLGLKEDSEIMKKLEWLGIFEDKSVGLKEGTPAEILQKLLEEKWALGKNDIDMISMYHHFEYELDGLQKELISRMVILGEDQVHTAMSITVGLPVAIATKLILTGVIKNKGVQVPIVKDIYEPVMAELAEYGIRFDESERDI